MAGFWGLLWGTLALRPYVFIFLAVYLLLATWHLGLGRALIYLLVGYLLAWSSELSSIHTGLPYGRYIYIEATRGQELWVLGVPFMDSLSYVFLSYASYTLALLALNPGRSRPGGFYLGGDKARSGSGRTLVLASVLFMTLDIVIDPLALRGYRWFLGQIYGYPEPGLYFGITLSNFLGWLVMGFVLIGVLQRVTRLPDGMPLMNWGKIDFPGREWLGPGLYFAILAFNLVITFYIGETLLGLVGCFIYLPFVTLLAVNLLNRH
ncbi:MAG: carotenoid biosynthesis protein [Deltaproteobacteria bacterium]|nr:carotenoid biosynthesis protein [Deltaproteobacteria bacterium]MBW1951596.1 carotenoid biosynthesis protein [Deltaproteobacteria bacterium]MBW1986613.1 carotenoid biosynthesis protein [Deltaproteobacteria bacterium]MBW2134786.1 carotenoid biosynthesis protein [Deltaproteobacteria bacterium]